MRKVIATLLTLCLVTLVVPPVPNGDTDGGNSDDAGISTCEYSCQGDAN
ncbi:MAG: hypothetical protein K2G51_08830 [Lachnospiraceae bacterium]|nr:hypothetical protein [Lachnospiraceae bacterium]